MRRKQQQLLVTLVVLAAVAALTYALWPKGDAPSDAAPAATPAGNNNNNTPTVRGGGDDAIPDITPAIRPADTSVDSAGAKAAFSEGMKLLKANRFIDARNKLAEAIFSGRLDAASDAQARSVATQLAELTILSAKHYKDDPYSYYSNIKFGDTLGKINQREKLRLDYRFIMRVNGIVNDRAIRAGSRIKLVRGPAHAIISKGNFTMDLYLHRQGLPKVYIKRVRVGLGRNGSTPEGLWRVALGEKMVHPVWNPSTGSKYAGKGPIGYGDPRYAFGKKGLWIGLEGAEDKTRGLTSYGIHSTNAPDSIGRADSEGCIRLKDQDIELVYALLYEKWSTVTIVP